MSGDFDFDNFDNNKGFFKALFGIWAVGAFFTLAFWAVVFFIVLHFVAKVW